MKSLGIHVLSNRSMVIDGAINLAGVMDMMGKRFDFEPPDLTKALLRKTRIADHFTLPST